METETAQYYAALRNAVEEPNNVPPPKRDVIKDGKNPLDHKSS
jgi:hypothetical protein